jgi:hypothetical protein
MADCTIDPMCPIRNAVVRAYDSMPRQRWRGFGAYCAANTAPTSLLSFVEYLTVCADRSEAVEYREIAAVQRVSELETVLRMLITLAEANGAGDWQGVEVARAALVNANGK